MPFPPTVTDKLIAIYEDLLWLVGRKHVTPAGARVWYTAVWAVSMRTKVRVFSGRVSRAALQDIKGNLCLEHYNRLSAALTSLLKRHITEQINDPADFVLLIEECEKVNITTSAENRVVQARSGDYNAAGIQLVEWRDLSPDQQSILWCKRLRGKVSNAHEYEPRTEA